jgi:NAD+ synthase (glutamine-hydrolysing)
MNFGFIKAAAASPKIKVANPSENAKEIVSIISKASNENVELLVFPELCVSGYTCGELFLSAVLENSVESAVKTILKSSVGKETLIFFGSPVWKNGKLYSCAIAVQNGKILGVIPKTYLPSYCEFYENRHFSSGKFIDEDIDICGFTVPFSTKLLFAANNNENIKISAEICEDLFVPSSPSINHVQAGASIIVNLSASNELIGKNEYRQTLIKAQSAKFSAGYVYSSAGEGESVSDLIFSGVCIIAENGIILKEKSLFESGFIVNEIDCDRLIYERKKSNTFEIKDTSYREIKFNFDNKKTNLSRIFSCLPFAPQDAKVLGGRAELIFKMQSVSLAERLRITGLNAVIGISGGLDSCLALLVILRAYKKLNKNKKDIVAVTMPGPGTSSKTLENVFLLAKSAEIKIETIPINSAVQSHLKDIKHSGRKDLTFENAQARERTQILMDIANLKNGLVVGTGDLSEIALGWCTYCGDHMSMYNVNSSIPKTLVKYLVKHEADREEKFRKALYAILNTKISPELLPSKNGGISQQTESIIGSYELHDFFLYYLLRFGQTPSKIFFLACKAFDKKFGKSEIKKTFKIFLERFFENQFKRNCCPDGIKVGTVSLSPRGDWRMASETSPDEWFKDLEKAIF